MPVDLYSTTQAAQYLDLSVAAVKYHIRNRHLEPVKIGHSFVFTKTQLDQFKQSARPQGRPRKDKTQ